MKAQQKYGNKTSYRYLLGKWPVQQSAYTGVKIYIASDKMHTEFYIHTITRNNELNLCSTAHYSFKDLSRILIKSCSKFTHGQVDVAKFTKAVIFIKQLKQGISYNYYSMITTAQYIKLSTKGSKAADIYYYTQRTAII